MVQLESEWLLKVQAAKELSNSLKIRLKDATKVLNDTRSKYSNTGKPNVRFWGLIESTAKEQFGPAVLIAHHGNKRPGRMQLFEYAPPQIGHTFLPVMPLPGPHFGKCLEGGGAV